MLRTTKPDKEIFLERKDIKDILFRFQGNCNYLFVSSMVWSLTLKKSFKSKSFKLTLHIILLSLYARKF